MITRFLIILVVLFLTACQDHENRVYVHWGEAGENVVERLSENGIDYKLKNGEVYIPRDQLKKATYCCT
ncbi:MULTISPECIES: hypothetical protein [Fictibacillus]|uniref:hypothetical protein n=1 Tax=Fictibacillus TaxID=1329200 RepID=UPI0010297752|nr:MULTISPECIES: hypothetical protein [Fictibacillus]RZT23703.1 hypothetical protein EV282_2798 [Fictibacillus sp. BK138]